MSDSLAAQTDYKTEQSADTYGFVMQNPAAGEGKPEKIREQLQAVLGENAYDLHETNEDEDLRAVVEQAIREKSYDWVAAVGGDGTVSQVADGLVASEVPLLLIPAGTGNVLARTLGIPEETEAAVRLIKEAHTIRELDSIQIGEQHFFLQLGIGLESVTMENTSSAEKNRWGLAAYLWTAVKEAFGWQPYHLTLTIDGQTKRLPATELVIANASKIGVADLEWDEKIYPDDGRIDIAVAQARSLLDYLHLLADLLRGTQRKSRKIQFFAATETIRLDAEKRLPIHGDGETLEHDLPLEMRVVQGALRVVVPA